MSRINLLSAASLVALAGMAASAAHAQGSPAQLEEIVVTAQQRSENIQEVPITIQAFSAEKLASSGVASAEALQMLTPGLTMSRNASASTPFIRGIGSPSGTAGNEAAVATYVDGVYRQLMYTNTSSLSDIERVEVLKGPQGTLYGRNTTGGLIHIITKEPSQERQGEVSATAGNFDVVEAKGFVTGGLTDTVAASLSGYVRSQGKGFGKNLTIGGRVSDRDEQTIRGKIQYKGDDTKITLAADYAHIEDDRGFSRNVLPGAVVGLANQPATWTTFTGGWHDSMAAVAPRTSPPSRRANVQPVSPYSRSRDYGASLTAEHSFESFDVISISGWRDSYTKILFDNDWSRPVLADALIDYYTKNFTQEVRLTSKGDSAISWIVGAFYLDSDAGAYLETPTVINSQIKTKSYAAFAEVGVKMFDDRGKLTLGGRYTIDKRHVRGTVGGSPDFGVPGAAVPGPAVNPRATWKEPTYRIVYSHQLSDDVMVYGGYNRGFKSGNYNIVPATTPAYEPEKLDAFEIGLKSTLAGGRIRFNAAAFHYDYKALQLVVATSVATTTVNAAGAKVDGVEGDLSFSVTDSLTLDLGASYIDGRYTDFRQAQVYVPNVDPVTGAPVGGARSISFDASGKKLMRSPSFMGSGGVTYKQPVAGGEVTAVVRAQYNSSMPWEPSNRLKEDPYILVNASIGYESDNGWGVRVQGANILGAKYSINTGTTNFGDVYAAGDPATYSVTLSYRF